MSKCDLCHRLRKLCPLCWECIRSKLNLRDETMGVSIISEGPRNVSSLNIPFRDATLSSRDNMWIMKVRMQISVDLYWRVCVHVLGVQSSPKQPWLFPQEADLPDGIHIPYTNGVTLVGFFVWDDDRPTIRKYFQQTANILERPTHATPNFRIDIVQVLMSPTFLDALCRIPNQVSE